MASRHPITSIGRSAVASSSKSALRSLATAHPVTTTKPPTAIVMMNMGGPSTIPEVHDFLSRLFHDHDLIPLPAQRFLAPIIAKRRTPKIEEQYTAIGGGSPILRWTREQGRQMCDLLDELRPESAPHKPYVAFRYAQPLTETALTEMRADGVQRAVAFTQYPQYSCSTTGSSLNELYKQSVSTGRRQGQNAWGGNGEVEWSVMDRWPTNEGLVDAFAQNIKSALERYPRESRDKVVLLFSAHSLPIEIVNRGDPYTAEVAATVYAVMQKLGFSNPWRLTWQSQVGPKAWQGPQTSDSIEGLAKLGHKDICLVPIAFTSDHIETLFELDIEVAEEAHKLGVNLQRADSLNDSPIFVRAIADLVKGHLDAYDAGTQGPTSKQLLLRCPGCTNKRCEVTKGWLAAGGNASVGAQA